MQGPGAKPSSELGLPQKSHVQRRQRSGFGHEARARLPDFTQPHVVMSCKGGARPLLEWSRAPGLAFCSAWARCKVRTRVQVDEAEHALPSNTFHKSGFFQFWPVTFAECNTCCFPPSSITPVTSRASWSSASWTTMCCSSAISWAP